MSESGLWEKLWKTFNIISLATYGFTTLSTSPSICNWGGELTSRSQGRKLVSIITSKPKNSKYGEWSLLNMLNRHSELSVSKVKVIIYSISANNFLKLTPSLARCIFSYLKVHLDPIPTGPLSSLIMGDYLLTEVLVRCINLLLKVD